MTSLPFGVGSVGVKEQCCLWARRRRTATTSGPCGAVQL